MSTTKARILARHAANLLLQTPVIPSMRVSDQDLSADQPTVSPDATIRAGSLRALEQGQTHYAEVPGITPLREKIAAHLHTFGTVEWNI
jgi:aspartate/methionine/tyrosine aminotransferase